MSRLSKACSSGCVRHSEGISGRWMNGPGAACLRRKEPAASRPQRLSRHQVELVRDRCRRAAVALHDLAADRVVLAIQADARRSLDHNRERECGQTAGVTERDRFLVEPWTTAIDDRRHRHPARSATSCVHREANCCRPSQRTATSCYGHCR